MEDAQAQLADAQVRYTECHAKLQKSRGKVIETEAKSEELMEIVTEQKTQISTFYYCGCQHYANLCFLVELERALLEFHNSGDDKQAILDEKQMRIDEVERTVFSLQTRLREKDELHARYNIIAEVSFTMLAVR